MECPARSDSESIRDEKVKVLKAIPPIDANDLIRGQFKGYLHEKGVAPNSSIETFAALCLQIKSWRWDGVPFYIRAGKNLPVTCTEVIARLRKPPSTNVMEPATQNYMRFRISPEMTIALAVSVSAPVENGDREEVELEACRHPRPEEMEAYERVLTDAMAGDATLFARQDYVEEAWRIVDPVLKANPPVYPYAPHTWGPSNVPPQILANVTPPAGWQSPLDDAVADELHLVQQPVNT
jgi:glucose-6-phosphate 1-dehydrogenase